MGTPIRFYEPPEEYWLCCEFREGPSKRYRCSIGYDNIIQEVWNKDDEIVATSIQDLKELGVVEATLEFTHTVELQ